MAVKGNAIILYNKKMLYHRVPIVYSNSVSEKYSIDKCFGPVSVSPQLEIYLTYTQSQIRTADTEVVSFMSLYKSDIWPEVADPA